MVRQGPGGHVPRELALADMAAFAVGDEEAEVRGAVGLLRALAELRPRLQCAVCAALFLSLPLLQDEVSASAVWRHGRRGKRSRQ